MASDHTPVRVNIEDGAGFVCPEAIAAARRGTVVEVSSGFVCGFPTILAQVQALVPNGRYRLGLHAGHVVIHPAPDPGSSPQRPGQG